MTQHYTPFEGDGRATCECTFYIPGCTNIPIRRSLARDMIDRFEQTDHSNHSGAGGTLWVILLWCQRHKISYVLHANPGAWYLVKRVREKISET